MLNFARFRASNSLKTLKFTKLWQINVQNRAFCTTQKHHSTTSETEDQLQKVKVII